MPEGYGDWLSLYLDFESVVAPRAGVYGRACDALINGVVKPVIDRFKGEGWAETAFFVRYHDGQPHVRLRLLAPAGRHEALTAEVADVLERFAAAGHGARVLGLRTVPYEPELARYGGAAAMRLSEQVFDVSSRLVLDTLPSLGESEPTEVLERRFGHAVMGAVLLAATFIRRDVSDRKCFLARYSDGVVAHRVHPHQTNEFRESLETMAGRQARLCRALQPLLTVADSDDDDASPAATAQRGFRTAREKLVRAWHAEPFCIYGNQTRSPTDAFVRLVPSHLHMHMNRLGLAPVQEALACSIAAKAFEEEHACIQT